MIQNLQLSFNLRLKFVLEVYVPTLILVLCLSFYSTYWRYYFEKILVFLCVSVKLNRGSLSLSSLSLMNLHIFDDNLHEMLIMTFILLMYCLKNFSTVLIK